MTQRRISLLDKHVEQCLSSCLNTKSWSTFFNHAYSHTLKHYYDVLVEFECPDAMLKTYHKTWHQTQFKSLMRRCVKTLFNINSNLHYRDSSTDSNDSFTYSNDSSTDSEDM